MSIARLRPLITAFGFLSAMSIATTARADDAGAVATRSYAWQTLAVDGAAIATIVTGIATNPGSLTHTTLFTLAFLDAHDRDHRSTVATDVGVTLYTVGAPIVHAVHLRPLPALSSLGLRAFTPSVGLIVGGLLGIIVGVFIGDSCLSHGGCRNKGAFDAAVITGVSVGLVGGFGVPIVLDALFLAREDVPKATPPGPPITLRVTPRLAIVPNGGAVGLSGTF